MENNYAIDLRTILENLSSPDYVTPVEVGNMQIHFRPISYKQANENTMSQFEDQKLLEMVPQSDISDEEKIQLISSAYLKLGEMTMKGIANSIDFIIVDDNTVTENEFILEFVKNADRKIFNALRDRIMQNKQASEIQSLTINCNACDASYQTPFTMDASNFFA